MRLTFHKSVKLPFLKVHVSRSGKVYRTYHFGPVKHYSRSGKTLLILPWGFALAGKTRGQKAKAHKASEKRVADARAARKAARDRLSQRLRATLRDLNATPLAVGPRQAAEPSARSWSGWNDRPEQPVAPAGVGVWGQPVPVPKRPPAPRPGHHYCGRPRTSKTGRCRRIVADGSRCPAHP